MTTSIRFFVHGTPKPNPRPRPCANKSRNGKQSYYLPGIEPWKRSVCTFGGGHVPRTPLDGLIAIDVTVWLAREEQMQGPGWPDGPIFADNVGSGDSDNYVKPIMDALTSIDMWIDDVIVVTETCTKLYVPLGGDPGADVRIDVLDGPYPSARLLLDALKTQTKGMRRLRNAFGQCELIGPRDPLPDPITPTR